MNIQPKSLLLVLFSILSVQAAEVGDITTPESSALGRRVQSQDFTFLGFGPGYLQGVGDDGFAYHLQGGWWREPHPNAAIRVMSDIDFRSGLEAWKVAAGIGAVWLPSRQAMSPIFGADFGWGFANGDESTNGFTLGGSAGVQMFRTASTQMSVELRSSVILDGDLLPWSNALAVSVCF